MYPVLFLPEPEYQPFQDWLVYHYLSKPIYFCFIDFILFALWLIMSRGGILFYLAYL